MKIAVAFAALPVAHGFGYHHTDSTCNLASPSVEDAPGAPYWVQTGPVMKLWTTSTYARDMITSGTSADIEHQSFYTPFCTGEGYTADRGCVVTCNDGVLDTETYCAGIDINTVCVPFRATQMAQGCDLDWDTDEDVYDMGASLKSIWAETLAAWDSDEGLTQMFTTGTIGLGANTTYRLPFFPHNYGNLINMGITVAVGVAFLDEPLSMKSFNLGAYTPEGADDYQFVEDPMGSTSDGPVFFADDFASSPSPISGANITGVDSASGQVLMMPHAYPAESLGLKATYIGTVAVPYDPCYEEGNPRFMGLPKSCFHAHQAGPHMGNGQMWPFYKPLKDGTMDFFGVCSADELSTNEYLSNAALLQHYSPESYVAFNAAATAAGTMALPHGRTWGVHFCINLDDPTHPYACTLPSMPQQWKNGALGDMMILDPLSFVHNPVQDADEMCARHQAGDCDWQNMLMAFDETLNADIIEYPIDQIGDTYLKWSPYASSSSKSSRRPRSFILGVGLAAGFGFLALFCCLPFAVVVARRRRREGARDDLPSRIPTASGYPDISSNSRPMGLGPQTPAGDFLRGHQYEEMDTVIRAQVADLRADFRELRETLMAQIARVEQNLNHTLIGLRLHQGFDPPKQRGDAGEEGGAPFCF